MAASFLVGSSRLNRVLAIPLQTGPRSPLITVAFSELACRKRPFPSRATCAAGSLPAGFHSSPAASNVGKGSKILFPSQDEVSQLRAIPGRHPGNVKKTRWEKRLNLGKMTGRH
jgi:hypothetical protein